MRKPPIDNTLMKKLADRLIYLGDHAIFEPSAYHEAATAILVLCKRVKVLEKVKTERKTMTDDTRFASHADQDERAIQWLLDHARSIKSGQKDLIYHAARLARIGAAVKPRPPTKT